MQSNWLTCIYWSLWNEARRRFKFAHRYTPSCLISCHWYSIHHHLLHKNLILTVPLKEGIHGKPCGKMREKQTGLLLERPLLTPKSIALLWAIQIPTILLKSKHFTIYQKWHDDKGGGNRTSKINYPLENNLNDDYMNDIWWNRFSKSNLNELVDDQVGIAEAQPQRDQMQPSLAAFLACCWWSSWLGSLPLVVTTSKSCSLPLASDCKCSVGIVHHLCIKGNVYAPKASAELQYIGHVI